MSMSYPIVEYAHIINKNTAEFTVKDLAGFMKWWIKQPDRKDLLAMSKKFKDAQMSRLPSGIDPEVEVQDEVEGGCEEGCQIICEMGLTQADVDALLWAINTINEEYELSSKEPVGKSLLELKVGLEGVGEL